MLPVLKELGTGGVRKYRDIIESLAKHYQLTEEELATLLPSGTQRISPPQSTFSNFEHYGLR